MYNYEYVDQFIEKAIEISELNNEDEAYKIISSKLTSVDSKYLNDCLGSLNYLQSEKCLDWIEENIHRIESISLNWGHLAAISKFNWIRAEKWIDSGRPLSLVALDAINFCTAKGEKLNMSIMMREINPKIMDDPKLELIAEKIQQYKIKDKSPRVKNVINKIIENLFI